MERGGKTGTRLHMVAVSRRRPDDAGALLGDRALTRRERMGSFPTAGLLVFATFVAACAGGDSEEAGNNPKSEQGLTGRYSAALPELEMPKGAKCGRPTAECLPPPSTWVLKITDDKLVLGPKGGDYPDSPIEKVTNSDARSGTLLLGPSALPCIVTTGPDGPGTYSWTIEGDTLRFRAEQDNCVERRLILTTPEWHRA